MIRKTILSVSLTAVICVVSILTFAYYRNSSSDVLVARSQSPDGVYLVKLFSAVGNFVPFVSTRINATIYEHDHVIADSIYFTSFDNEDDFNKRYPQNVWVDRRTMRYNVKERKSSDDVDVVLISNESKQRLRYLKVSALDYFLILDIQPKERVELKVPRQIWQSWIEAEGMFDGGLQLKSQGVNFFHQDKFEQQLRYCIDVKEDELIIHSSLIEGWTFNNPKIPVSPGCDK